MTDTIFNERPVAFVAVDQPLVDQLWRQAQKKVEIRFYVKEVYGAPKYYPVDFAEEIQQLTGCKTLRDSDFAALKVLGFVFQQVFAPKGGAV